MADLATLETEFMQAHQAGDKARAGRLAFVIKRMRAAQSLSGADREKLAAGHGEMTRKAEASVVESANPALAKVATTLQGVPFVGEGTDEAIGWVADKMGRDGAAATEKVRLAREGLAERDSLQSTALQLGGGALAAIPAAVVAAPSLAAYAPASLLGQVGLGAGAGASLGALEGAASGYLAGTDPESRAEEAGRRAGVGGLVGLGVGAAGPLVSKGVAAGAEKVSDWARNRIATAAGMSPNATRVINTYLADIDPSDAARRMATAGDEAMLADAGYSARKLTDAAMEQGGVGTQARAAIESRAARSADKLNAALDTYLGKPGVSSSRDLVVYGERRSPLRLLYERAYRQPIDYSSPQGMEIERLIRENVPADAINKANRMLRADPDYAGSKQIMAKIADDGSVTFEEMPDVVQLDLITRALNDVAEAGDGAGKLGGMTDEGRIYSNLSRRIRDALKDLVPEYRQAVDAAGTEIGKLKANDLGYEVLSGNVRRVHVAKAVSGMSDAELRKVREGMRDYIDDQMARTKRALTDPNMDAREAAQGIKLLTDRSARDKMALVLGDKEATALQAMIDEAATGVDLRASLAANTQTFARQQTAKTVEQITSGGPVEAALRMEPVVSAKTAGQVLTGRTDDAIAARRQELWREVVNELVKRRGTGDAQKALDALNTVRGRQAIDRIVAARLGQEVSGAGGASAYLAGTRDPQPRGRY